MGYLRRLPTVAVSLAVLSLCFATSAVASTASAAASAPAGVMAPTTRPVAIPGLKGIQPVMRADVIKGVQPSAQPGISTRGLAKAMGSRVQSGGPRTDASPSTDAFIGYEYYSWGYSAVYNGVFDSGGYTWYYQIYYFYNYSGTYLGYGYHLWYYYFGWNYYGWTCCGY